MSAETGIGDAAIEATMVRLLRPLNRLREREAGPAGAVLEDVAERLWRASRRLAVYGSLAPGEAHHGEVAGIRGVWSPGRVRGRLEDCGWGARLGFPALSWDPAGAPVPVQVLTAAELPEHWRRLDAFEGAGYLRLIVPVRLAGGALEAANLYAARPMPGAASDSWCPVPTGTDTSGTWRTPSRSGRGPAAGAARRA